ADDSGTPLGSGPTWSVTWTCQLRKGARSKPRHPPQPRSRSWLPNRPGGPCAPCMPSANFRLSPRTWSPPAVPAAGAARGGYTGRFGGASDGVPWTADGLHNLGVEHDRQGHRRGARSFVRLRIHPLTLKPKSSPL